MAAPAIRRMQERPTGLRLSGKSFSTPADLLGHRYGRAIDHKDHQRGSGAKGASRNTVVAAPASVGVLDSVDVFGHLLVPLLPLRSTFYYHALTDSHVTQELLAPVG